MKKIFIFLALVVIIVALVGYKFISYKNEQNQIQKENLEFDKYKDQDANGIDVASLINKAIDAYVGYYDDAREFVEQMFDVEYPECTNSLKYYIDFDLYEKDLMYDYFNVNGHIFKQ